MTYDTGITDVDVPDALQTILGTIMHKKGGASETGQPMPIYKCKTVPTKNTEGGANTEPMMLS